MWQILHKTNTCTTYRVCIGANLLISYVRTYLHTYSSINIVAFAFDLQRNESKSILKQHGFVCFIWMSWWRFLNELVAFSNCLPLGHLSHRGTFLLIVSELLSLSFSSGPFIAAFSASAWKGSQMSFRMASATPLEIQVERNRCSVILIFLILCFFIRCVS